MSPGFDSGASDDFDNDQAVIRGGTDNTKIGNIGNNLLTIPGTTPGLSHPMISRTDLASAARTTTSTTGTGALDTYGMGSINFIIDVTAVSGTNPVLQVLVDASEDGVNWGEFITSQQFTATGNERLQQIALGSRYYRFTWVISGTTPSFTFSIMSTLKAYMPKRNVKVDKYADIDLATDGAVSSVFASAGCVNVSVVSRRGADGGSGAKVRIQASNNRAVWDDVTPDITHNVSTTIITNLPAYAFRFYRFITVDNSNAGTRTLDLSWGAN